jgi:hypothetical protein
MNTNNTFDITRDCTLAGPSISVYNWNVQDKALAAAAAASVGINKEQTRSYVTLLNKVHRQPLLNACNRGRKAVQFPIGTPWDGKGLFLIPNVRLESTLDELKVARNEFYQAVESLINALPDIVENAPEEVRAIFDRYGVPTATKLRDSHSFEIRQSAIVSADDLRLNHVSPAARASIEDNIRREQANQIAEVQKACVQGIEDALRRVAEDLPKFSDGKIKRFEDTLITGLSELCESLPALNFTHDPTIDRTLGNVNALVAQLNLANQAKVLRAKDTKGTEVRGNLAKQAGGILAALKSGAVSNKIAA